MTYSRIITTDGGSAQYWSNRKEGFRLIREAEAAIEDLKRASMYIRGEWDDDYGDYEPVENLAPFDRVEEAITAIEANAAAVSILVAQGRICIGDYEVLAVNYALAKIDGPDR